VLSLNIKHNLVLHRQPKYDNDIDGYNIRLRFGSPMWHRSQWKEAIVVLDMRAVHVNAGVAQYGFSFRGGNSELDQARQCHSENRIGRRSIMNCRRHVVFLAAFYPHENQST